VRALSAEEDLRMSVPLTAIALSMDEQEASKNVGLHRLVQEVWTERKVECADISCSYSVTIVNVYVYCSFIAAELRDWRLLSLAD
jgi:hypothetical protein